MGIGSTVRRSVVACVLFVVAGIALLHPAVALAAAPVATADPDGVKLIALQTQCGRALVVPAPGVLANDWDLDGDPVVAELVAAPSHGTVVLGGDGSFTYTPAAGWAGSDAFTYRLFDGSGYSEPVPVALTVTAERVEQTDMRIAFSPGWQTVSAAGASGSSLVVASGVGSGFQAAFSGTGIAWLALTGPTYGIATVTVDGGAPTTVDLYSPAYAFKQTVFERHGLASSTHTLKVELKAVRNAASEGARLDLDALDVEGALTTATSYPLPITRFEQSDTRVAYAEGWQAVTAAGASGGSLSLVSTPGAGFQASFKGTGVSWVALTGPTYGIATVTVDGGAPVAVDLYGPTYSFQTAVFRRNGLQNTDHTFKVELKPVRNAASVGTRLNLDGLDVEGVLTSGGVYPPVTRRYEQTDGNLRQPWGTPQTFAAAGASGGSLSVVATVGTGFATSFTGTGIAWVSLTGPTYGIATVTVDGSEVTTVDLYSPTYVFQKTVFERRGLSNGEHSLRVKLQAGRNPSSTMSRLAVDALDVDGVLTYDSSGPVTSDDSSFGSVFPPWDLHLTATDPSGVLATYWRLNGMGPYTKGTVVALPPSYGWHTVYYYSEDWFGNIEPVQVKQVFLADRRDENECPGLRYHGSWTTREDACASGGTYAVTAAGGTFLDPPAVEFSYIGARLDIIAETGSGLGTATIIVDGHSKDVSLDGTGTPTARRVYSTSWDSSIPDWGSHSVSVSSKWDPVSGSYPSITLDALDVSGALDYPVTTVTQGPSNGSILFRDPVDPSKTDVWAGDPNVPDGADPAQSPVVLQARTYGGYPALSILSFSLESGPGRPERTLADWTFGSYWFENPPYRLVLPALDASGQPFVTDGQRRMSVRVMDPVGRTNWVETYLWVDNDPPHFGVSDVPSLGSPGSNQAKYASSFSISGPLVLDGTDATSRYDVAFTSVSESVETTVWRWLYLDLRNAAQLTTQTLPGLALTPFTAYTVKAWPRSPRGLTGSPKTSGPEISAPQLTGTALNTSPDNKVPQRYFFTLTGSSPQPSASSVASVFGGANVVYDLYRSTTYAGSGDLSGTPYISNSTTATMSAGGSSTYADYFQIEAKIRNASGSVVKTVRSNVVGGLTARPLPQQSKPLPVP